MNLLFLTLSRDAGCDRLIEGLSLDACVQIHDHRGTHEGSERELVCTLHHDGLIGPHPSDAGPRDQNHYEGAMAGLRRLLMSQIGNPNGGFIWD